MMHPASAPGQEFPGEPKAHAHGNWNADLATQLDGDMALELLLHAPDPKVVVDAFHQIVFTNLQVERVFGYATDEMLGRSVHELLPPRMREGHDGQVAQFFERPGTRPMGQAREVLFLAKDGREIPVEISLSSIGQGRDRLVVANIRDVSEHLRMLIELEDVNQRLSQKTAQLEAIVSDLRVFAQTVSHDLQAPLRQISQFLALLDRREGTKLSEDSRGYLNSATQSSQRLTHMIQDILAYSRIGISSDRMQPIETSRVLEEVVHNLSSLLEEHRATVVHDELPVVMADGTQVLQLFQNLIGNALVHHGEQAPRIEVSGAVEGARVRFCVSDNGPGIDERHHRRIFEMFQRPCAAPGRPGAGVGLAICKRIVERHEGELKVESIPGQGARFIFTLPSVLTQPSGTP